MTERVPRFTGQVRNGQVHFDNRQAFDRYVAGMGEKRVMVTVEPHRKIRSLNQNAFYWACVVTPLAAYCGYDQEEMHDALRERFLRSHEDSPLPTVRSTTKLNTVEFTEYLENCIRLAAEMGVVVAMPGEMR